MQVGTKFLIKHLHWENCHREIVYNIRFEMYYLKVECNNVIYMWDCYYISDNTMLFAMVNRTDQWLWGQTKDLYAESRRVRGLLRPPPPLRQRLTANCPSEEEPN